MSEFVLGEGRVVDSIPDQKGRGETWQVLRNKEIIRRALSNPEIRVYSATDLGVSTTKQVASIAGNLRRKAGNEDLPITFLAREGEMFVQGTTLKAMEESLAAPFASMKEEIAVG